MKYQDRINQIKQRHGKYLEVGGSIQERDRAFLSIKNCAAQFGKTKQQVISDLTK